MDKYGFVGREKELEELNALLAKKTSSLVVITGRRRIGKSRLIEEFARGKLFLQFSGLAPVKGITPQKQRDEFSRLLSEQTALPEVKADDWGKLFSLLADRVKRGRVILLLDEISWMAKGDPTFLSKLKNIWDLSLKKNPQLILIICGSVSSWIEKNIISSVGYFGRYSLKIVLNELSLKSCNLLLRQIGFKGSNYEKLMLLSISGGVPWYIEQINPNQSALSNIKRLCFLADGLLVDDFKYIFNDLFGKRKKICGDIVRYLTNGSKEYQEIAKGLKYTSSGSLSSYLNDLKIAGFIQQDFVWNIKTNRETKLCKYRLSDNYLRFYLKYIEPSYNRIKKNKYNSIELDTLPAWSSIIGLQFENLVLSNRDLIYNELGLKANQIKEDNPYFQHSTAQYQGCQIDYLIQTIFNSLFVCEIKFSRNELHFDVTKEVAEKIKKFVVPKYFSCFPVLIHISGVDDAVKDSNYFYAIIDIGKFLE